MTGTSLVGGDGRGKVIVGADDGKKSSGGITNWDGLGDDSGVPVVVVVLVVALVVVVVLVMMLL